MKLSGLLFAAVPVAWATLTVEGVSHTSSGINPTWVQIPDGELYPSFVDNTQFGVVSPYFCETPSRFFRLVNDDTVNPVTINSFAFEWLLVNDASVSQTVTDHYSVIEAASLPLTVPASDSITIEIQFDSTDTFVEGYNWVKITVDSDANDPFWGMSAETILPEAEVNLLSDAFRPLLYYSFGNFSSGSSATTTENMRVTNIQPTCNNNDNAGLYITSIQTVFSQLNAWDGTTTYDNYVTADFGSPDTTAVLGSAASASYWHVPFGGTLPGTVSLNYNGGDGIYTARLQVDAYGADSFYVDLVAYVGQETSAPTPEPTPQTFDWGTDCTAGTGTFTVTLDTAKEVAWVGDEIPVGIFNLYIELEADADLDIWLYDTTDKDPNDVADFGKPLVRWCTKRQLASANAATVCGNHLGQNSAAQSVEYEGMYLTYSGWTGGDEWICVSGATGYSGMTTVPLQMVAYAYEVGSANVTYTYEASCAGTPFLTDVAFKEVLPVGTIPANIGSVYVKLTSTSDEDIDVQLYDQTVDFDANNKQAIVAWCQPKTTCNYGNDLTRSTAVSGEYPVGCDTSTAACLPVQYSGWNGIDGDQGQEYVIVPWKLTDRALDVKVYGYREGEAKVEYWWTVSATLSATQCGGNTVPAIPS